MSETKCELLRDYSRQELLHETNRSSPDPPIRKFADRLSPTAKKCFNVKHAMDDVACCVQHPQHVFSIVHTYKSATQLANIFLLTVL